MKKLIYISHPYSGLEENSKEIEEIMFKLCSNKEIIKNNCFVSPVHNYGYMYSKLSYDDGLQLCLDLLNRCDFMILFGDWQQSKGCTAEVKEFNKLKRPMLEIPSMQLFDEIIASGSLKKALNQ